MAVRLEPIATIGYPPAHPGKRDGCADRPPKRQGYIGHQAQYAKRGPEDLSLHSIIVNGMRLTKTFRRQKCNIFKCRVECREARRNLRQRLLLLDRLSIRAQILQTDPAEI